MLDKVKINNLIKEISDELFANATDEEFNLLVPVLGDFKLLVNK